MTSDYTIFAVCFLAASAFALGNRGLLLAHGGQLLHGLHDPVLVHQPHLGLLKPHGSLLHQTSLRGLHGLHGLHGLPHRQVVLTRQQPHLGLHGLHGLGQRNVLLAKPHLNLHKIAPAPIIKKIGYGSEIIEAPEPYESSANIKDEYGNVQTKQESGDAYGNKQGSYTIQDITGLTRIVKWVADDNGVRMWIKTNEPGTSSADPADVQIEADPVVVHQPKLHRAHPLLHHGQRLY